MSDETNDVEFLNGEVPEELQEFHGYPFIQWVNRGNSLVPAQKHGGFAAPADQGIPLSGEYCQLVHSSGDTTEVFFTDTLQVVPVAKRFAWDMDGTLIQQYASGARGKLQVLAWVQTQDGVMGPLVITMKGMASKAMSKALKEHTHAVATALRNRVKKPLPWFAWMELKSGTPQMVGKGKQRSLYTPVEYVETEELELIGRDLYQEILSYAEEIARWKQAWREMPRPNGDSEVSDDAED